MADIYRVPYSASFVSLPSKSGSFVSPKPTRSVVWQQSLSLLAAALSPPPVTCPGTPRPGLGCEVADPVRSGGSAAERNTRSPRGCDGSMVGQEKEQVSHSAGLGGVGSIGSGTSADPGQM